MFAWHLNGLALINELFLTDGALSKLFSTILVSFQPIDLCLASWWRTFGL